MSPSYEGNARECASCSHVTNVHRDCDNCQKPICENCEHGRYCSRECEQSCCTHDHLHYEMFDDVDEDAGYVRYFEVWTCRDCGAEIDEDGEIITRRAA